jgi:hypothetical protein
MPLHPFLIAIYAVLTLFSENIYVVPCSQSNYARTRLSVASTLNMDYIQNLTPDLLADEVSFRVKPYLLNGQIRTLFEELGYETVAFSNRFKWLNWPDADYFLHPGEKSSIPLQLGSVLTPFEELFLNTNIARAIIDLGLAGAQVSSAPSHREFAPYMLDTLPKIPKIQAPNSSMLIWFCPILLSFLDLMGRR